MAFSSTGTGRVQASERDALILGRRYIPDRTSLGIVFCHQNTYSATTPLDPTVASGTYALLKGLADAPNAPHAGYPVISQDLGTANHFGNPTSQARALACRTLLQTIPATSIPGAGAKFGSAVYFGISAGFVTAVDMAAANPYACAGIIGVLPLPRLDLYYSEDRGGGQAGCATAWGVTAPNPLPALSSPHDNAAAILTAGIPVTLFYSSDDAVTLPAEVTAFASAVSGTATSLGALGHTETAIAAVPLTSLLTFMSSITPTAARLTTQDNNQGNLVVTYPVTPTSGNLLVAAVYADVAPGSVTAPAGWSTGVQQALGPSGAHSVSIFYKVAGGSESTTYTFVATGSSNPRTQAFEWTGVTASPADKTASSADSGSSVTSHTTGTTAAVAQSSELAFAVIGLNGSSGGITSWSNGFTSLYGLTARLMTAFKIVRTGGTVETTAVWATSNRSGGAVMTFKAAP